MSKACHDIEVTRELYIPAPPGVAVYAQNPAYTSVAGRSLLESVKHEALHFGVGGDRVCYHQRIFRRRSDDNGATWTEQPDQHREAPDTLDGSQRHVSGHVLDERRDRLISMHGTYEVDASEPIFSRGNLRQRTYRMWCEWSADGGRTWTAARQMIDSRPGHDATHWAPGITYGQRGAIADLGNMVFLDDGSFVVGLTAHNIQVPADMPQPDGEGYSAVLYARGRWNADGSDIDWCFGDLLIVPPNLSVRGGGEPSVVHLGGERLFVVMRCQGDEARGLYSTRYCSMSDDGGATWGELTTLTYDDGSPVHTPASFAKFFHFLEDRQDVLAGEHP